MRLRGRWRGLLGLLALLGLAGCADTKDALEKKGIEVKSTKVMKVYRF